MTKSLNKAVRGQSEPEAKRTRGHGEAGTKPPREANKGQGHPLPPARQQRANRAAFPARPPRGGRREGPSPAYMGRGEPLGRGSGRRSSRLPGGTQPPVACGGDRTTGTLAGPGSEVRAAQFLGSNGSRPESPCRPARDARPRVTGPANLSPPRLGGVSPGSSTLALTCHLSSRGLLRPLRHQAGAGRALKTDAARL